MKYLCSRDIIIELSKKPRPDLFISKVNILKSLTRWLKIKEAGSKVEKIKS